MLEQIIQGIIVFIIATFIIYIVPKFWRKIKGETPNEQLDYEKLKMVKEVENELIKIGRDRNAQRGDYFEIRDFENETLGVQLRDLYRKFELVKQQLPERFLPIEIPLDKFSNGKITSNYCYDKICSIVNGVPAWDKIDEPKWWSKNKKEKIDKYFLE